MTAPPLPVGVILSERFELLDVLGQSVFTTTYKAKDRLRGDLCVVKELSPDGATRDDDDVLDLSPLGVNPQHLRQRFTDEVRRVGRLNLPSVLPVRSTFSERGTAYYVIDFIDGTVTLADYVLTEGRMDDAEVQKLLPPLIETLEALHQKRIVHKDIRPENLLLTPRKRLLLVGPGGAREWLADAREAHEVFFDSPYAAPEETNDRQDRGAATDVYGLSATLHYLLTGTQPPSAPERVTGTHLQSVHKFRKDVDPMLAEAIEAGMSLQYLERPQTIGELARLMLPDRNVEDAEQRLERLDQLIYKMRVFSFEKRQCPACKDVLETPQPLAEGRCPVCHDGYVKERDLSEMSCAACGGGVLRKTANEGPLEICPICRVGRLDTKRKSFFSKEVISKCRHCEALFEVEGSSAKLVQPEPAEGETAPVRTWSEWRELSGRPSIFYACDTCEGQYDPVGDGRRRQVVPTPTKWKVLYPEEWAKVAAGLSPGAGNAECTACKADFYLDDDRLTLLSAHRDPFGFAARHLGRLLKQEDLEWKGVGKESPKPGLVCAECQTELDFEDENLRLIRTGHPVMRRFVGHTKSLEDWHRLADGLPISGHEHDFDQEFDQAIAHAYESGTLAFEEKNDHLVIWRSQAIRLEERRARLAEGRSAQLLITPETICFGGPVRRWKRRLSSLVDVSADENVLTMKFEEDSSPVLFELTPVELTIKLQHSKRTLELNALNLALRLSKEIKIVRRDAVGAR